MSKATTSTPLDLFDSMDTTMLEVETLISALISCEAINGASNIDRAAYLEIVSEKAVKARQQAQALWVSVKGAKS